MNIIQFYPVFWALCGITAAFGLMMLDIMITDLKKIIAKRRMKLRDKLHLAMTQSRGLA